MVSESAAQKKNLTHEGGDAGMFRFGYAFCDMIEDGYSMDQITLAMADAEVENPSITGPSNMNYFKNGMDVFRSAES